MRCLRPRPNLWTGMSLKYGTVLATKQEFFFAKLVPRTNHNWHCTIGYLILFFRKEDIYFFECLYFSEYDVGMLLFVFWLRNRPSIKYVRNWRNGGGSSKMCTGANRGEGYHASFLPTHLQTITLFMFLS